ncbi:ATP-binding protein [Roseibium sp. RKSG952]|uniref:AAA family ATPase n=1 Tax=Roseibium sp. RKSG952 TaxID=2529384 RepID=UPI0012BCF715|nr:ATP-binding protein [Roseibium sp. RKSG952]MTH95066.1 ATP-binding protein [Roseibium sp. RKSG952]
MSHEIEKSLLERTKHPELAEYRDSKYSSTPKVRVEKLSEDAIIELREVANRHGETKLARALKAIIDARQGVDDVKIPSFAAALEIIYRYLKKHAVDGWIYHRMSDGRNYPCLVRSLNYHSGGQHDREHLRISVSYFGPCERSSFGLIKRDVTLYPSDVTRKTAVAALLSANFLVETANLRAEYNETMSRFHAKIKEGFAEQFRINGRVHSSSDYHGYRRGDELSGRKVIHDTKADEYPDGELFESCDILDVDATNQEGLVPVHPLVRVFDLTTHDFYFVNSDAMEPYVYDKTLSEKLVLPESHRNLLDILTSDIDLFVDDFIEGKSAGNIVLCKGLPGVGKTLTAEVYSELIERPLYCVKAGTLGTNVTDIAKGIKKTLDRARRWNCVLLLNEADIFVMTRSNSLDQNAIVAEFLMTLEYFEGLLFMTTNRPHNIDEAIISRCSAIITYDTPDEDDRRKVWRIMATQFQQDVSDDLIRELVDLFPTIAQRDIRNLMRLTARVARKQNKALSANLFRQCAMFRAVEIAKQAQETS